jgi:hypothetical protein
MKELLPDYDELLTDFLTEMLPSLLRKHRLFTPDDFRDFLKLQGLDVDRVLFERFHIPGLFRELMMQHEDVAALIFGTVDLKVTPR